MWLWFLVQHSLALPDVVVGWVLSAWDFSWLRPWSWAGRWDKGFRQRALSEVVGLACTGCCPKSFPALSSEVEAHFPPSTQGDQGREVMWLTWEGTGSGLLSVADPLPSLSVGCWESQGPALDLRLLDNWEEEDKVHLSCRYVAWILQEWMWRMDEVG